MVLFLFTHFNVWLSKIPVSFYCEILLSEVCSLEVCDFPACVQRSTVSCHWHWVKSNSKVTNERATQNVQLLLKSAVQPFRGETDWHRLFFALILNFNTPLFFLLRPSWHHKCLICNQLSVFNYTGNCQETFLRY